MSSYPKARRGALLLLFLMMCVAGAVAPANAVRYGTVHQMPLPDPPPAPAAPAHVHHAHVVADSGQGPLIWLLAAVFTALVVAGVALVIVRYRHAHRTVLSS